MEPCRIGQQFDNIRAAFDRSLEADDLDAASTICTELWDYAFMRLNIEYLRWAERMIEIYGDRDEDDLWDRCTAWPHSARGSATMSNLRSSGPSRPSPRNAHTVSTSISLLD